MKRTVLYVVSRYPKVTETFVVNEWLALRARFDMRLAALIRTRDQVVQHEATALLPQVIFLRASAPSTLAAHVRTLRRARRSYVATLRELIRGQGHARAIERMKAIVVWYKAVLLAEIVRTETISHVHAHFANHPTTAAWVVHRLVGVPFSFTAHANDLFRQPWLLDQKLDDAAFVVAISEYNADLIRRQRPQAVVEVVHCGVDVQRFDSETRAPRGCRLLCVASFEPKKGHRVLIEALARVRARFPNVHLVLIGDGTERASTERLAADIGVADVVDFRGARDVGRGARRAPRGRPVRAGLSR